MRLLIVAVSVAFMATGCGTSADQVLAERLDAISAGGCEAVEWEATSETTSDLSGGGRPHTVTADEDEAACGFGMHTWQRTEEHAPETSPAAVVVVARRSFNDPPPIEGDVTAHAAKQHVAGAGRAEVSSRLVYQGHVVVAAVNEEHVGELHPERVLRAARRDLGIAE